MFKVAVNNLTAEDKMFKVAVCRIVAKTIAAVKFKTLQCVVSPPSSLNWLPGG